LPERRSTIVAKRIERADIGERHDFIASKAGARDELVERSIARRAVHARDPVVGTVVTETGARDQGLGARDKLDHGLIIATTFRTNDDV
jgi:hypothetical protein